MNDEVSVFLVNGAAGVTPARGAPVGRMQAALATAVAVDPQRQEF